MPGSKVKILNIVHGGQCRGGCTKIFKCSTSISPRVPAQVKKEPEQ
uniref:Uncharacterized protein n=1 Tax=Arundo donax TaxID=35708 RepID=A0A0A9AEA5_ARUDO